MRSVSPIPIVSLVGRSNSGKTTFIEKLITILQDQGLRVACVKQHHRDVEVDVVGKDSWRYARAGAACSIIATPVQISFVHQVSEAPSLVELASMAADAGCDVVLAESFGAADTVDRYVTARIERSEDPMLRAEETAGLITDDETLADVWKRADKPTFDLNDPEGFATYLRTQYAL